MPEPEIVTEFHYPPPRDPVAVVFRRTCHVPNAGTFGRAETATFERETAEHLVRQTFAVPVGAPLDEPEPDETPVAVRLLRNYRTRQGQHLAANERATLPKHEMDPLIASGGAKLDDGRDHLPPASPVTQRRERVRAHARRVAQQILERYRS